MHAASLCSIIGYTALVELLILRRADVNFTNNRGDTTLHYTARHKDDVETVTVLV